MIVPHAEAIVIDANVAIDLASREVLGELAPGLAAPPLLMIETRSVLHRLGRRNDAMELMRMLQHRIEIAGIRILEHPNHAVLVWTLADELDWDETYDAEYLASARAHGFALATYDRRLARAAGKVDVRLAELP